MRLRYRNNYSNWLIIAIFSISLVSCSGDDEEGEEEAAESSQQPGQIQSLEQPQQQDSQSKSGQIATVPTKQTGSSGSTTNSDSSGSDDGDDDTPPPPPPDTTPPTLSGLANDGAWTTSKSWSWTCNEGCDYRFVIDQSPTTEPTGAWGATDSASQSSGTGTFYLHVQARDAAGNESTVVHVSALLDHSSPMFVTTPDVTAWDGEVDRARTTIWAAGSDGDSGLSHYMYAIGADDGDDTCEAEDLTGSPLTWIKVPAAADFSGAGYQVVSGGLDGDGAGISMVLAANTKYCTGIKAVDNLGNETLQLSGIWELPFRPHYATGLVLWLDAADSSTLFQDTGCLTAATTEDDPVQCWKDKSTSAADATGNGSAAPLLKTTGSQRVDFAGGSKYLTGNSVISGTGARTLLFMTKVNSLSTTSPRNCAVSLANNGPSSGSGYGFFIEAVSASTGLAMRVSGNRVMDYTPSTTDPVFLSAQNGDSESVSTTDFYADGVELTTQKAVSSQTLNTDASGYALGGFSTDGTANPNNANYDLDGELYEVLAYNVELDPTTRQKVEGYFACKWGRQDLLDGAHPHKTVCP